MRYLARHLFTDQARQYYGGDVQAWYFIKEGPELYSIVQRPHYGHMRVAACVVACSAREARKRLERYAASGSGG